MLQRGSFERAARGSPGGPGRFEHIGREPSARCEKSFPESLLGDGDRVAFDQFGGASPLGGAPARLQMFDTKLSSDPEWPGWGLMGHPPINPGPGAVFAQLQAFAPGIGGHFPEPPRESQRRGEDFRFASCRSCCERVAARPSGLQFGKSLRQRSSKRLGLEGNPRLCRDGGALKWRFECHDRPRRHTRSSHPSHAASYAWGDGPSVADSCDTNGSQKPPGRRARDEDGGGFIQAIGNGPPVPEGNPKVFQQEMETAGLRSDVAFQALACTTHCCDPAANN